MPNFAKIGRTVPEIWPIFDFQDGGRCHLVFFGNFKFLTVGTLKRIERWKLESELKFTISGGNVFHKFTMRSVTVWPICTAFGMMTHIGPPNQTCYSRKFVRQFLCINFAYANSYVRNANHKTLLRMKNRKFVLKYTHDLSCRTAENFCKDSELTKLPQCLVLESQHKFVNSDACKM